MKNAKKLLSILLALILCLSVSVFAFAEYVPELPSNVTLDVLSPENTIGTNNSVVDESLGTINNNNGTVVKNSGTVHTNNGTVGTDCGTVDINNGTIGTVMYGDVGTNNNIIDRNICGEIETNKGTIDKNQGGDVENNEGTINVNGKGMNFIQGTLSEGTVSTNNGTIKLNKNGVVEINNNKVEINGGSGLVDEDGELMEGEFYAGTIEVNNGTVDENREYSVVNENNGKVTNVGGTVKENYGEVVNTGGTIEGNIYNEESGEVTKQSITAEGTWFGINIFKNESETDTSNILLQVNGGASITVPSLFTRTGFTLLGYANDRAATSPVFAVGSNTTVTSPMMVFAVWQQDKAEEPAPETPAAPAAPATPAAPAAAAAPAQPQEEPEKDIVDKIAEDGVITTVDVVDAIFESIGGQSEEFKQYLEVKAGISLDNIGSITVEGLKQLIEAYCDFFGIPNNFELVGNDVAALLRQFLEAIK